MSIYKLYTNHINTFVNSEILTWRFKSNPSYTYMLEHVNKDQGIQYLKEIQKRFNLIYDNNNNYLRELCHINDLYGNPIKQVFNNFTTCSPTNLRYILHSLLILKYANDCNLYTLDIIEIGGGYGGLCFFINKLSNLFNITINTYTIFDLPEPLVLQNKYLNKLDINNVKYYGINNFKDLKLNSFLVSTYAFSEIPFNLQQEYTVKILNPYISYGFIAWNNIDVYNFIENKNIYKETEFPLTSAKNYFVVFKPM
jgi:putative sugar O-methyltransferase